MDSNFIILISKGKIDFEKLRSKYDLFCVSIITYMEVYAFDFENSDDRALIDEVFTGLEIIGINQEIADQAVIYRKNKVKKIKLPDAIILATAKITGADLLTENYDDFRNLDDSINIQDLVSFRI